MKDPKQFEGKVSYEEALSALTRNYETVGHYWDEEVPCNKCPFVDHCDMLGSIMPDISCIDVINILLGDATVEEVIEEKKRKE
jgi:hypothetical protein